MTDDELRLIEERAMAAKLTRMMVFDDRKDWDFVTNVIDDIPALIAEVRRLREADHD